MNPAIFPDAPLPCPASRMYHQASSLGPQRIRLFGEAITRHAADDAAGRAPAGRKTYPARPRLPLPPGEPGRGLSLIDAMRQRRTQRSFTAGPITLPRLASLLRSAIGLTGGSTDSTDATDATDSTDLASASSASSASSGSSQLRAWPSAGGRYPIETYLLPLHPAGFKPAIYHFSPHDDALSELSELPPLAALQDSVYAPGLWERASLLIVLTAVWARTQAKYGERGYRFVHQEAGHVMQNLLLMAGELELGAAVLGGFFENELAAMMGLETDEESPVDVVMLGSQVIS